MHTMKNQSVLSLPFLSTPIHSYPFLFLNQVD